MKKAILCLILIILLVTVACNSFSGNPTAPEGPAPNSGDGVPDGSGMDGPSNNGPGPAPNSGDGVPDGSGF